MPVAINSGEEQALLNELEAKCREEKVKFCLSDVTLLRFLRGRKHDLEGSAKAVVRHCKWRTDECVSDIKEADIPNELAVGKIQVHGSDKLGRPVVYIFAQRYVFDGYSRVCLVRSLPEIKPHSTHTHP